MRRPAVLPIAILLAILTAVALMRTAAVVSEAQIDAPVAEGSKAVAREFYAALNEVIRDNDPAALVRVASPDLVVHRPGDDPVWGRADLAGQIAELRAAYPDMQIVVDDLVADRDRVLARVRLEGDEGMGLRGFPVAAAPRSDFTDSLRIHAGRVVEYAGIAADLTAPRHVLRATFEAGATESAQVGVARLTLDPGAGFLNLVSPGPTVYVVEAGRITFESSGAHYVTRAAEGAPPPSELRGVGTIDLLGPGDQIAVRAGAGYSFHAADAAPATALAMTLMPPNAKAPPAFDNDGITLEPPQAVRMYIADALSQPSPSWPVGVVSQPLVGGLSMALPPPPFAVAIWRVTLAPDAVVAGHEPNGREIVAVETGGAVVATTGEERGREVAVMGAGSSIILDPDAATAIQNAGDAPLVLLVLSLTSTNGPATPAIPPSTSGRDCVLKGEGCLL